MSEKKKIINQLNVYIVELYVKQRNSKMKMAFFWKNSGLFELAFTTTTKSQDFYEKYLNEFNDVLNTFSLENSTANVSVMNIIPKPNDKICGSDFECIKKQLTDCAPVIATINSDDYTFGHVVGILQITGKEKDLQHQIYGCGANYVTNRSTFHSKKLKGHLIIENAGSYDKLINLVLSIEGYLEGSGQIIKD